MIDRASYVERISAARGRRLASLPASQLPREGAAEGGCGVIGIASSEAIPGRHLLQSLRQMRNRGNGKGGGAALVGLEAEQFGVTPRILRDDFLLTLAFLEPSARAEVEEHYIEPGFSVDHVHEFPLHHLEHLDARPPTVVGYFVRPKREVIDQFAAESRLEDAPGRAVEEEWVYQNSFQLNSEYYASLGEQRAFVLSHGKDMLALKMVGYGDDVIHTYGLEDLFAHVWIGHHRYPTKGKVWHPGGAHPFVGMHDALVHNGDFANYESVCSYLEQQNIRPLFLTDTEVSVLVFDLLHRTFGYPLEYVIEAMAPTTERDFSMLPDEKRRVYRMLQTVHMHGSPDGPWFFLIAQSEDGGRDPRTARLIGITDTSMLRPQVFALQRGAPGETSIGFAASEKQAIDAALESLAAEDARFWTRPDKYWNARGGSHTDGGAFLFDVVRSVSGENRLVCRDKFGREIDLDHAPEPYRFAEAAGPGELEPEFPPLESPARLFDHVLDQLADWSYEDVIRMLNHLTGTADTDVGRWKALEAITLLMDRRYPTYALRRSSLLSLYDRALCRLLVRVIDDPTAGFAGLRWGDLLAEPESEDQALVIDAEGFPPEGDRSLARTIAEAMAKGYRRIIVFRARGQRFLANGLGGDTAGLRIDVYGSPGDYLASGIDGAEVFVHNNGQDQLAQIMKNGKLVVHGDVGQTFMYAAKGGETYVLGNAAGRPLINAVGSPRVVINGTCLDYLAESFMAGDPLDGGGFVILNGMSYTDAGELQALETPYPGGNLFSLASGGAIFIRDPYRKVGADQLNGGAFTAFTAEHWNLIEPMLRENENLFGVSVQRLLTVGGDRRSPEEVYRAVVPTREKALQPEEAWVAREDAGAD